MSQPSRLTPQLAALRTEWPRTCRELEETFFQGADWAVTTDGRRNDAGYLLWGLRQFAGLVDDLHAHHSYSHDVLDRAAANEVGYLWDRKAQFRRAAAALTKCFRNLAIERPEKIERAGESCKSKASSAATALHAPLLRSSMATPSLSPGQTSLESCAVPIGSVLPALTRPSAAHTVHPQQSQLGLRFPISPLASPPSLSPGSPGRTVTGESSPKSSWTA